MGKLFQKVTYFSADTVIFQYKIMHKFNKIKEKNPQGRKINNL